MIGDNAAPGPCGVTRAASYFFESEDSATDHSTLGLGIAFVAVLRDMSGASAEHAKLVIEALLPFFAC